jgi:hypothetical protein
MFQEEEQNIFWLTITIDVARVQNLAANAFEAFFAIDAISHWVH